MYVLFLGLEVEAGYFEMFGVNMKGTIISKSLLHLNPCVGLNWNLHRELLTCFERADFGFCPRVTERSTCRGKSTLNVDIHLSGDRVGLTEPNFVIPTVYFTVYVTAARL